MVDSIGQVPPNKLTFNPENSKVSFGQSALPDVRSDSFLKNSSTQNTQMSKDEYNKTIHDAKVHAAFWSTIFAPFATLYYGTRSDESIAKKYKLDVKADKAKIKEIRGTQTKVSFCTMIPGTGLLPLAYFALIEDPNNQKILKPKENHN